MYGYEIKPCKMCGMSARIVKEQLSVDTIYKIKCRSCNWHTRGYFEIIPAIDAWNGGTKRSISYESNGFIPSKTMEKKKTAGSR